MDSNGNDTPRRGLSRSTWVLLGFLAVAAFFLLSEHRAHFISYLPFLLVAACPLLHLFHGHGHHGGHGSHRNNDPGSRDPADAPEHQTHQR